MGLQPRGNMLSIKSKAYLWDRRYSHEYNCLLKRLSPRL